MSNFIFLVCCKTINLYRKITMKIQVSFVFKNKRSNSRGSFVFFGVKADLK